MPGRGVLNCAPPVAPSAVLVQSQRGVPNSGADRGGVGGALRFGSSRRLGDRSRCAPKSGATASRPSNQLLTLAPGRDRAWHRICFSTQHAKDLLRQGSSRRRIPRRARLFVMGLRLRRIFAPASSRRGGKLRALADSDRRNRPRAGTATAANAGCHVELDQVAGNAVRARRDPLAPGTHRGFWQNLSRRTADQSLQPGQRIARMHVNGERRLHLQGRPHRGARVDRN